MGSAGPRNSRARRETICDLKKRPFWEILKIEDIFWEICVWGSGFEPTLEQCPSYGPVCVLIQNREVFAQTIDLELGNITSELRILTVIMLKSEMKSSEVIAITVIKSK